MRSVLCLILVMLGSAQVSAQSGPAHVEVVADGDGFALERNGKPYHILGAGAKAHFPLLKASGANSIRLWSTGKADLLDSALRYDMTVSLGLYVRPERTGMDYDDEYAVRSQIEQLKTEVLKYKDHPAVLVWGIGNEMDLRYANFKVWETIEEIAAFIHQVDPHHPTMTVVAGFDPAKSFMIRTHCPSVDILGVNAYGSIENLSLNIRRFNWDKPYIVTEWGVNGPFEAPMTAWKAKVEPPGGVKAEQRKRRYLELIEADREQCLGSYCFLWGQKQESTATWHGMFTYDGRPTDAVDAMHYCWTGSWPEHRAPSVMDIRLNGIGWRQDHVVKAGETATLDFDCPLCEEQEVELELRLFPEGFTNKIGGDLQERPDELNLAFESTEGRAMTFTTPSRPGAYRVFLFAQNPHHQVSVANIPFLVE
ncbi:MAG: glycoside hydrolase family 2 TIM barrel-domain containing protein [Bacteroidota bacterium]|nr:glycoside hydrolase family 2 TIM barrel-domain containing protein [Bacteroidota bacterium]